MQNSTWHSDTIKGMKSKSDDSLMFIINDCLEAAKAGKDFNPKVGQYLDEMHYAAMELKSRRDKKC